MKRELWGLDETGVRLSREQHGDNRLLKEKHKSFLASFFENLGDPIIKVLLIAVALEVIVTFRSCNWFEVGGIILAVLIATLVSTVSEYGSERAFRRMQEENSMITVRVRRSGKTSAISADELVIGDIIYLSEGDVIPADARLLSGMLTVDQSALNGESREVIKEYTRSNEDNSLASRGYVHRGSIVLSGDAIAVVSAVGGSTYYGAVAKEVQQQTRESPLKLRLSRLASLISRIGYVMADLVGGTYLFISIVSDNGYDRDAIIAALHNAPWLISTLSHALTLMITVIVVAVPEGLPMMITVVLSANMKRMLHDNIMVKKLVGIETAGSMNLLFTDKTGTLTTGKSTVERVITAMGEYKSALRLRCEQDVHRYLCATAKLGVADGANMNGTDKALAAFFNDESIAGMRAIAHERFTSDKKYSSVTLAGGERIIRGAPELILSECKAAVGGEYKREYILKRYKSLASSGARMIAVALVNGDGKYSFLALIAMRDRLRPGVCKATSALHSAGIQVVMLTGDSEDTARAIAEECGILRRGEQNAVLTHEKLAQLSDSELMEMIPELRVVARALPSDKSRLVALSQRLELVVGMTGDGINDAPSLKLADVGFVMGSGTDIAKGAGDIVIMDDSLEAITKTVLFGRTIFKSIRKFVSFQLMMNIAACGISLIGQMIGIENPITIIQMLWINIIMDTLGGLAFSGEPPLDYYLKEPPKRRDERILSWQMLAQIFITGGYTLLVCILFLTLPAFAALFRSGDGGGVLMTAFYALFVFMGLFNCFNTRSERLSLFTNIGQNKPFIIIMLLIATIQIFIIYLGGDLFRSVPLTFRELLNVILIAASVIPFDALRRIIKKMCVPGHRQLSLNEIKDN